MFTLNQKVIYPGQGIATVNRIIQKNYGGKSIRFFELKFLHKEMTILVPTHRFSENGIRKICTQKNIQELFELFNEPVKLDIAETTTTNWNKRNKDYHVRIRTGDINEISKVYCELLHIATLKELSFGEKGRLKEVENFLAEEIAAVLHIDFIPAIEKLRAMYTKAKKNIPVTGKHGGRRHFPQA